MWSIVFEEGLGFLELIAQRTQEPQNCRSLHIPSQKWNSDLHLPLWASKQRLERIRACKTIPGLNLGVGQSHRFQWVRSWWGLCLTEHSLSFCHVRIWAQYCKIDLIHLHGAQHFLPTYSAKIEPVLTFFLFGRACLSLDFRLLCSVNSRMDARKVIIFRFI